MSPNRSFDGSCGLSGVMSPVKGHPGLFGPAADSIHPPLVANTIYASSGECTFFTLAEGQQGHLLDS